MNIDAAIRQCVEQSDKTINQIAQESGVPQPVLQRFMAGTRPNLLMETVQRLFNYFRIEVKIP